jgi:succinate dehydrogenase hydrophobic anchor subunit
MMNSLSINFLKSENNDGFRHWFFQRISALSFLIISFIVYFTNSAVFGGIGLLCIISHINSGLDTLIADYMHDSLAKIYTEAVLDILLICLAKSLFLIFIFI